MHMMNLAQFIFTAVCKELFVTMVNGTGIQRITSPERLYSPALPQNTATHQFQWPLMNITLVMAVELNGTGVLYLRFHLLPWAASSRSCKMCMNDYL